MFTRAHEQHMDAARRLAAAMASSAGQSRQRVAPEVRSRLAREASPEANPEEEHEAIASDPAVPFASAEIGRGLREVYHGPEARERIAVIADEAGVHPEEAQRIADQHTAFAAGRDLQKILEGGRTTPEREAALEKLGLLTLDRNADGSITARVTDDATPLLPKTTREELAQDANAYGDRYEVTPGTPGDAWASHADAGRRRFAESAATRSAMAGQSAASPGERSGNSLAGASSPVDAMGGTASVAPTTLDPKAFQHPDAKVRNLAKAWQRLHEILGEGRELNTSQRVLLRTAETALQAAGMLQRASQGPAVSGAAELGTSAPRQGTASSGNSTMPGSSGSQALPGTAGFHPQQIIAEFVRRYAKLFGVRYTDQRNHSGGISLTTDGRTLIIHRRQVAETLAAVPPEQREAKLRAMLDEELTHVADIAVNSDEESAALWKSLPESIQQAVQAIYTRERANDAAWRQMSDVAKAREFKRMLVQQQRAGGGVTELLELAADEVAQATRESDAARSWVGRLLRHLRKIAAWLTGNDGREAMRQVRAVIDEIARIQAGGDAHSSTTPTERLLAAPLRTQEGPGNLYGVSEDFYKKAVRPVRELIKSAQIALNAIGGKVIDRSPKNTHAQALHNSLGESRVVLNIDDLIAEAFYRSDGDANLIKAAVTGIIREELVHSAFIEAIRRRWRQSGSEGSFESYYRRQTMRITEQLMALREIYKTKGDQIKLAQLERAVEASWNLYHSNEGFWSADEIFKRFSESKDGNDRFVFAGELIRMLVELNRDGSQTDETHYRSLMGVLVGWMKEARRVLREALAKIKEGDSDTRLIYRAIQETETVLKEMERRHPAALKLNGAEVLQD